MKGYRLLLPLLLISALLLTACQPIQPPAAPEIAVAPTPIGAPEPAPTIAPTAKIDVRMKLQSETITSESLAGNLLGDPADRVVNILLPAGYAESDKRYPVVYVLPWGNQNPWDNPAGFKLAMERLLLKGEAPEMIIVVPDGNTSLGGSYFLKSPTIGDYETYLTQEVVNYIDANFRTLAQPESRGLGGCSSGGSSSMRIALEYPNIFSVAAPRDGVYNDGLWEGDAEYFAEQTDLPTGAAEIGNQFANQIGFYFEKAAAAAANPDNPPLYLDAPLRVVDGKVEVVPEVLEKIIAADTVHLLPAYMTQPVRLRALLLQFGALDDAGMVAHSHEFDALLTEMGIDHEVLETNTTHCSGPWEADTLKFMADNLVFEQP